MFNKKALTQTDINPLLASRWSGRAYDADRPVPRQHIIAMMEAARWAPSCFGDEPWRFIVCDRAADPDGWDRAYACLVAGNQEWARNAPVLVLILADSRFTRDDKANRWGRYDTGAAAMSICVQATDLGLMVHQMGGFDPELAASSFGVPDRYEPMSMMAIGYQLDRDAIPGDMLEREQAPRQRRGLGELFFESTWGRSISG